MEKAIQWPQRLLTWYAAVRRDLPWRRTKEPYRIWVSEMMLQQTRVETVKAYYQRFLERFPDVQSLADAPEADELKCWEGLGYYSRARNMQKAAQKVMAQYQGAFPKTAAELVLLPGIGDYTAGAVASIAFHEPVPAIDGNVKRVMSRLLGIRQPLHQPSAHLAMKNALMKAIPTDQPGEFNQALMELGATHCKSTAPECERCPIIEFCDAYAEGDADTLPIREGKRPPKAVDVTVNLITSGSRVLLMRRSEKLLHGLYVFLLTEGDNHVMETQAALEEDGLHVCWIADCGEATHQFTHRLWRMHIRHFRFTKAPTQEWLEDHSALLADMATLESLPLPTAMKVARAEAIRILLQQ